MAEFSYLEQLQQLKAMTVRTNTIHEAQALQIRNYPLLLKGVQTASASVDIEGQLVTYELKVPKGFRLIKFNREMCKNISVWLKTLLWDQTAVVFQVGKRILFDSRSQDE
jgi:hypothetical protein